MATSNTLYSQLYLTMPDTSVITINVWANSYVTVSRPVPVPPPTTIKINTTHSLVMAALI